MGEVFYSVGALASADVVECSASDFSTGFMGQAALKTMEQLRKGLGKVLFVDEAYQLDPSRGGGRSYSGEVLDELVKALTTIEFKGKMVVILAGYDTNMQQLLAANTGLASRFTETYRFEPFDVEQCWSVLVHQMAKKRMTLVGDWRTSLAPLMAALIQTADWGNGRDIETLASKVARAAAQDDSTDAIIQPTPVRTALLSEVMQRMMADKKRQAPSRQPTALDQESAVAFAQPFASSASAPMRATLQTVTEAPSVTADDTVPAAALEVTDEQPSELLPGIVRDAGVSNADWQALERAKPEAAQRDAKYAAAVKEAEEALFAYEMEQEELREKERRMEAEQTAARRALYEKKVREQQEELERARQRAEQLRRKQEDLEAARRAEVVIQAKLQRLGVCVQGYAWIKMEGGYRCRGGSHWVSDSELR